MSLTLETNHGEIEVLDDIIAQIVGNAVTNNYGVIGMASQHQIRDTYYEILRQENYAKGVVVGENSYGIVVDVYIYVNYGTKISEICRNVQNAVKYDLEKQVGISASTVNVFVQGVKNKAD